MSESQIEEIEVNIRDAKEIIANANALDRLHKNRDFKKLILEGYFRDEPVRLVNLKADPAMSDPRVQENIVKMMDGIGNLRNHFRTIYQQADQAAHAIEASEETLIELREEVAE